MKGVKKIAILLLCTGFFMQLHAQDPDLPSEEIDVVKSFDARLGDAERLNLDPSLPPLDTSTRRLNYNIFSKSIPVDYLPPKIRPLAVRRSRNQEPYNGYLKLGGGFPASFYGDGHYRVSNDETYALNFFAKQHSANNGQQVENQKFSYTNVGTDGTYYSKDQGFAINGGLGYTRDAIHFYGYNEVGELLDRNFSFESEEVKQRFATFEGHAKIFNAAKTEADFNYYAGFDFYLMNDDYASRENGFDLLFSGTKWFNGKHPLKLELETDFTSFRDTATQNLNNFFFRPSFAYHDDRFKAKVGAVVASNEDNFFFFPDLELDAMIIEGSLSAYVGATGSLDKNTFRTLTDYNPFLSSEIFIRNSNFYKYYGGVRGNIEGVDYDAQVSYKTVDNLALFLLPNVFDTIPRFDVLYDTANILTIKGSLSAPVFEGFEVTGAVSQNFYTLEGNEEPWHLPALTINFGARYQTLEDKLLLKADFFLENGVPVLNDVGEAETLNTLFDISLGADYYFSKNIGGFVQINNLANNRRQRWQHYPTFGINAMLGIMARF
jgi:hypothetical protein